MTLDLISCEQYFSAVPWPETGLVAVVSFVVGALLGMAYGRKHPHHSSRDQKGVTDGR